MERIKSILVTKEVGSFPLLNDWCKTHQIELKQQSFITISPVLGLTIPLTDWIFFSSPKGVESYLRHYTIKANKIAVLGTGTLAVIKNYGLTATFVGDPFKDPYSIGTDFNALMEMEDTVLFPISQVSKKNVIKAVQKNKCHELITYHTQEQLVSIKQTYDVLFFTSPSNFNGFIKSNNIAPNTQLIAIGKTTAETIMQYFDKKIELFVLSNPSEDCLIEKLETLI